MSQFEWRGADTVYAFNGAALEIFQRARQRGVRCVLDQTAAPWRFNTDLIRTEQARWPGWESSPADVDPTGQMMAREEAEWDLADRIVCGSSFVVDAIRRVGGPVHKCAVVRYPLPETKSLGLRVQSGDGPLRVLFLGTLQLRKGIQYVWEAAGELDPRLFEFRAVGPSHLTSTAEDLIRSRIDWRGRTAPTEVWSHHEWADAFVSPSLSEGSANACWEAFASGAHVVATKGAGFTIADGVTIAADGRALAERLLQLAGGPATATPVRVDRSVAEYGHDLVEAFS